MASRDPWSATEWRSFAKPHGLTPKVAATAVINHNGVVSSSALHLAHQQSHAHVARAKETAKRREGVESSAYPFPAQPFRPTSPATNSTTTNGRRVARKPRIPRQRGAKEEDRLLRGPADFRRLEEQTQLYYQEREQEQMPPPPPPSSQHSYNTQPVAPASPQRMLMPSISQVPIQSATPAWSQQPTEYNPNAPYYHMPPQPYVPQFMPTPPPSQPMTAPQQQPLQQQHTLGSSYSTFPLQAATAPVGPPQRVLRPASAPPARLQEQLDQQQQQSQYSSNMNGLSTSPSPPPASLRSRPSASELLANRIRTGPPSSSSSQSYIGYGQPVYEHAEDEKEETYEVQPSPPTVLHSATAPIQRLSRHEQMYSALLRQTQPLSSTPSSSASPLPSPSSISRADPWSTAYMERLTAKHEMGASEAAFFQKSSAALSKRVTQPGTMFTTETRIQRRPGWWQPAPPVTTLLSKPPPPTDYDSSHGSIPWINPTPLPHQLKQAAATKEASKEFKPTPTQFSEQVVEESQPQLQPSSYPQLLSPRPPATTASGPSANLHTAILSHFIHAPTNLFLGQVTESMVAYLVDSCQGATTKELLSILWKMELSGTNTDPSTTIHSLDLPYQHWNELVDAVVNNFEEMKYANYLQRKTVQRYLQQSGASQLLLRGAHWGNEWGPSQETLEKLLRAGSIGQVNSAQQVIFHLHLLQSQAPFTNIDHLLDALSQQQRHSVNTIRELSSWLVDGRCQLFHPALTTISTADVTSFWFTNGLSSSNGDTLPVILQRLNASVLAGREPPVQNLDELAKVIVRLRSPAAQASASSRVPSPAPSNSRPTPPPKSSTTPIRSSPPPTLPRPPSIPSFPEIRDEEDEDDEDEDDEEDDEREAEVRFDSKTKSDSTPSRSPAQSRPRAEKSRPSESSSDEEIEIVDIKELLTPAAAASTKVVPMVNSVLPPRSRPISDSDSDGEEERARQQEIEARKRLEAKWRANDSAKEETTTRTTPAASSSPIKLSTESKNEKPTNKSSHDSAKEKEAQTEKTLTPITIEPDNRTHVKKLIDVFDPVPAATALSTSPPLVQDGSKLVDTTQTKSGETIQAKVSLPTATTAPPPSVPETKAPLKSTNPILPPPSPDPIAEPTQIAATASSTAPTSEVKLDGSKSSIAPSPNEPNVTSKIDQSVRFADGPTSHAAAVSSVPTATPTTASVTIPSSTPVVEIAVEPKPVLPSSTPIKEPSNVSAAATSVPTTLTSSSNNTSTVTLVAIAPVEAKVESKSTPTSTTTEASKTVVTSSLPVVKSVTATTAPSVTTTSVVTKSDSIASPPAKTAPTPASTAVKPVTKSSAAAGDVKKVTPPTPTSTIAANAATKSLARKSSEPPVTTNAPTATSKTKLSTSSSANSVGAATATPTTKSISKNEPPASKPVEVKVSETTPPVASPLPAPSPAQLSAPPIPSVSEPTPLAQPGPVEKVSEQPVPVEDVIPAVPIPAQTPPSTITTVDKVPIPVVAPVATTPSTTMAETKPSTATSSNATESPVTSKIAATVAPLVPVETSIPIVLPVTSSKATTVTPTVSSTSIDSTAKSEAKEAMVAEKKETQTTTDIPPPVQPTASIPPADNKPPTPAVVAITSPPVDTKLAVAPEANLTSPAKAVVDVQPSTPSTTNVLPESGRKSPSVLPLPAQPLLRTQSLQPRAVSPLQTLVQLSPRTGGGTPPIRLSISGPAGGIPRSPTFTRTPTEGSPTNLAPSPTPDSIDEDALCELCMKREARVQCAECDLNLCTSEGSIIGCDADVHAAPTHANHVRQPWSLESERQTELLARAKTFNATTPTISGSGVTSVTGAAPTVVIPPLKLSQLSLLSPQRHMSVISNIQLPKSPGSANDQSRRSGSVLIPGSPASLGSIPSPSTSGGVSPAWAKLREGLFASPRRLQLSPATTSPRPTTTTTPMQMATATLPAVSEGTTAIMTTNAATLPTNATAAPVVAAPVAPVPATSPPIVPPPSSSPPSGPAPSTRLLCEICDEEVAVSRCPTCNMNLCMDDDAQLHKPAAKKGHVRTPIV